MEKQVFNSELEFTIDFIDVINRTSFKVEDHDEYFSVKNRKKATVSICRKYRDGNMKRRQETTYFCTYKHLELEELKDMFNHIGGTADGEHEFFEVQEDNLIIEWHSDASNTITNCDLESLIEYYTEAE